MVEVVGMQVIEHHPTAIAEFLLLYARETQASALQCIFHIRLQRFRGNGSPIRAECAELARRFARQTRPVFWASQRCEDPGSNMLPTLILYFRVLLSTN